uniref:Uncharacterized protein n=1 Tax=Leptocylindrus danicus TaxID=163516 RepID=A0A7S2JSU4_9STRA
MKRHCASPKDPLPRQKTYKHTSLISHSQSNSSQQTTPLINTRYSTYKNSKSNSFHRRRNANEENQPCSMQHQAFQALSTSNAHSKPIWIVQWTVQSNEASSPEF